MNTIFISDVWFGNIVSCCFVFLMMSFQVQTFCVEKAQFPSLPPSSLSLVFSVKSKKGFPYPWFQILLRFPPRVWSISSYMEAVGLS